METRVAVIALIVEDPSQADSINKILHEYSQYIIARMGVPYKHKNISIISIAVDADADIIGALSGKLGMIKGVSAKTVYYTLNLQYIKVAGKRIYQMKDIENFIQKNKCYNIDIITYQKSNKKKEF